MLSPGEVIGPAPKEQYVAEVIVPLQMDSEKVAQAVVRVARRI